MVKIFILSLMLIFITPAIAGTYVTTGNSSPFYGGFSSGFNRPGYTTTTVRPYDGYNRRRPIRRYTPPRYCPDCGHYTRHRGPYGRNSVPVGNLNALERYALNKNYSRESDLRRLERLESLAFGAVQSGDMTTRYENVEAAILSRPQNNYRHSFLNNLANYFSGQATGFTPSINPGLTTGFTPGYTSFGGSSFGYGPEYGTQRIDQFNNGIWGNGFRTIDQNFGSGSSVRILD